jgi:hypothetical protein
MEKMMENNRILFTYKATRTSYHLLNEFFLDGVKNICRCLDITRATSEFGFSASTTLLEGLKKLLVGIKKHMIKLDFDIVVVANHHRKALILDYLKDIPHLISYSEDCDLPSGWAVKPEYDHLVRHMHGHIGHHRCIEGHKKALQMCKKDTMLVIEDDAIPNRDDWLDIAKHATTLFKHHELVSLHGRNADLGVFKKLAFLPNIFNYVPKDKSSFRYVLGSLAYLIKRKDIDKVYKHNYNGLGMDLFIANNFNFCFIHPSPLDHNRSQGSLIDIDTFI